MTRPARAWRDHPTPGGAQRRHFPPGSVPADTRRDKESPGHSDRGSKVIYGVIWRKNELTPQTPRYYPKAHIRQGAYRDRSALTFEVPESGIEPTGGR